MTDHAEMQIPSDILVAARLTYEGLPIVYDGWDEDEVIRCIARAILSERNRCIKVVEDRVYAYEVFYDGTLLRSECLAVIAALARVVAKIRSVDK